MDVGRHQGSGSIHIMRGRHLIGLKEQFSIHTVVPQYLGLVCCYTSDLWEPRSKYRI